MQSIKFGAGSVITAINAGTATGTSSVFPSENTYGYNAFRVYALISGTPTFTVKFQGALRADDTFTDYNSTIENSSVQLTASSVYVVEDIFPFNRVVCTLDSGAGTITVLVQPFVR